MKSIRILMAADCVHAQEGIEKKFAKEWDHWSKANASSEEGAKLAESQCARLDSILLKHGFANFKEAREALQG